MPWVAARDKSCGLAEPASSAEVRAREPLRQESAAGEGEHTEDEQEIAASGEQAPERLALPCCERRVDGE
jgi:hypothetical protein